MENTLKSLLIVDDEPNIRSALGRHLLSFLKEEGLIDEIKYASDGQEAYQMITANPEEYAVVISDDRMPNMTGSQLFAKLSEDDESSECPKYDSLAKILLSGTLHQVESRRPDVRYMTKPFDSKELQAIVAEEIRKARERQVK